MEQMGIISRNVPTRFKLDVMGKFRATDGNAYASTTSGLISTRDGGGGGIDTASLFHQLVVISISR
jgi:hypothetical protein